MNGLRCRQVLSRANHRKHQTKVYLLQQELMDSGAEDELDFPLKKPMNFVNSKHGFNVYFILNGSVKF